MYSKGVLSTSVEGSELESSIWSASNGHLTIRPGIGLSLEPFWQVGPDPFNEEPVKDSFPGVINFLIYDCNSKTIYDDGKQILVTSDGSLVKYTTTPSVNEQFNMVPIRPSPPPQ